MLELNPKSGPFFVVPSTYDADEEGWFTVSMLAMPETPVTLTIAKAAKSLCKLQGEWVDFKGGCYSKNGASLKSKSFKVGKGHLEFSRSDCLDLLDSLADVDTSKASV